MKTLIFEMKYDMKTIENMTVAEIKELKEQYKEELAELLRNFFKNHPDIDYINFFYYEDWMTAAPWNNVIINKENIENRIGNVHLKNEPKI